MIGGPAQANATVSEVSDAGVADDWDRPAGAGASKWLGSVRAYYRESVDRVAGEERVDVLGRRTLILTTADVDAMELDTDDRIAFAIDGVPGTQYAKARVITRSRLAGMPASVQTTRVELDAA